MSDLGVIRRTGLGALAISAVLGSTEAPAAAAPYDWLQFGGDPAHDGSNTQETALGVGNVASLQRQFHVALPAVADGAPVFLSGVTTSTGVHNLLFVTTKAGHIVALDAQTGTIVWQHQYGPGSCTVNNGSNVCYTTSSPAIDPTRTHVYSYGLDGYVHAYAVGDGTEAQSGGWPELVSLKPFDEKTSSALAIATATSGTYLYVTSGGYPGDNGDYQGHVTAINLSTGVQNVFNTQCSDQSTHFFEQPSSPDCAAKQSAVWARGGVVYDAALNEIFFVTGNATFAPSSHEWGDTLLAVHPDATSSGGVPIDSYTPASFQHLQDIDLDLGSTEPGLFPTGSNAMVPHLAVQGGKDAMLRLLNLDNLSGSGGPGNTGGEIGGSFAVPQGGQVLTAPAMWTNPADGSHWVFIVDSSGVSGMKLGVGSGGAPVLTTIWSNGNSGTSPIVANGVLYFASSNRLRAFTATTGAFLWTDMEIAGVHWESPIVANGWVYITDESAFISGYALPGAAPVPALPPIGIWMAGLLLALTGSSLARLVRDRESS